MSVLLGLVVGVLMVRLLVGAAGELLHAPVLQRANREGRMVPTAMGMLAVLAVVLIEGGRSLFGAFGVGDAAADATRLLVLFAVVGFASARAVRRLRGHAARPGFPRPSRRTRPRATHDGRA